MKAELGIFKGTVLASVIALSACSQKTPEEQLASAESHIAAGNTDAASIELKNALLNAPDMAKARFLLGKINVETGELDAAVKELERALEAGFDKEQVVPLTAKSYFHMEEWEQVVSFAEAQTLTSPAAQSTLALYSFVADTKISADRGQGYSDIESGLNEQDKILALAQTQTIDRSFDEALETLSAYKGDKQPLFYNMLGLAHLLKGNNAEAVDAYRKSKDALTVINSSNFMLSEALNRDGKFQESLDEIQTVIRVAPENGAANLIKARASLGVNDHEAALLAAEKAIQNGVDNVSSRSVAGISSYILEQYEKSYSNLNALYERRQLDPSLLKLLAQLQMRLGYVDEAKQVLLSLDAPSEEDAFHLAQIGTQIAASGDIYGARELLTRAKQAAPDNVGIRFGKAVIDMSAEDDSSVAEFESVIAQDPSLQAGWVFLAFDHLNKGNTEAALNIAKEWQADQPADGFTLEGMIQSRIGNLGLAEEAYKEALKSEPGHIGANIYYNKLLLNSKRNDEVVERTKVLLDEHPVNSRFLMTLVKAAVDGGKHFDAVDFLREHHAKHPNDPSVVVAYGTSLRLAGKVMESIGFLERNKSLLNSFGWMTLGDAQVSARQFENALLTYAEWREAMPADPGGWIRAIGVNDILNRGEQALELTLQGEQRFPEHARFKLLKLNYQITLGQLAEAEKSLAQLKQDNAPANVLAPMEANYYIRKKDYAKAVPLFGDLVESAPSFRNIQGLALSLIGNDQKEAAQKVLDEYTSSTDLVAVQRFAIADLYSKAGDCASSVKQYEGLLAENSNNIVWHNNVASEYLKCDRLSESISSAKAAMALLNQQTAHFKPYIQDTLGYASFKSGDVDTAFNELYEAYRGLPESTEVKLHLLEVLVEQKQVALADKIIGEITPESQEQSEMFESLKQKLL